ncbi:hypothetical protein ABZ930_41340 [Streptomyces sp. NPDC046716]|uniref:hypothetical protein n=1 Tax=Streptomyces sp. NPDC046716 TaxID=3157093 RepID=UPI0033E01CC6
MNRSVIRSALCGAALLGTCALTGTAAASAHASGGGPDGWREHGATWSWSTWDGHAAPAVVTAWSPVYVRDAPTVTAKATSTLPAGAHIRLFCQTTGDHVDSTSTWYFDNDAHGWVSAAHVRPTGWQPPSC